MYEFHTENESPKAPRRIINWKAILGLIVLVVIFISAVSVLTPPANFPSNKIITIENGSSLDAIANQFESSGLIKSAGIFKTFVLALTSDRTISIGDYLFDRPLNAWGVAQRLAMGKFGVEKITVTLPEGLTTKEMAEVLGGKLTSFNKEEFVYLAKDLEGYLFPDTYFFFGSANASDVFKMMRDNFNKKVTTALAEDIEKSGKSVDEIIIMASIIEAESFDGVGEKETISGILWKRIEKGMKLQVDATSGYQYNKKPSEITDAERKEDSPYNTYLHLGLPPTPIGNPGVLSIKAAIHPKDSAYFFYLHDKDAKIHYAKTYEEHKANINKYLK